MRADIHDGPEHTLQSEVGYIDARPYCRIDENLLHRTAGPYIGVITGDRDTWKARPVFPRQRTGAAFPSFFASGPATEVADSFDCLVSLPERRRRAGNNSTQA